MVVYKEKAGRMIPERRVYDLSGVNAAGCQGSLKKVFYSDNPVLGVQEDDLEDLPVLVSKAVIKIIKEFLGRPDRILPDKFLLKITFANIPDKLDAKDVLGADAFDLLELFRWGFNDSLQGSKAL
jgi:hypothetical protein